MIDRRAGDLLELLPAHDTMQWRTYSLKDPQAVLVISCFDDYELLACKERSSAGLFTLQYCSQRRDSVVRSWLTTEIPASIVEQDMVVDLPLGEPFKYSADSDPIAHGQSDLSVLIQWYFLSHGNNDIISDVDEYCTRFHQTLRNIESQLASKGSLYNADLSTRVLGERKASGSPEAHCSPTQGWLTSLKRQSPGACDAWDPVYGKLVDLLGNDASPHLLKDLPRPNISHFVQEENPLQNALLRKLPIGQCRDTQHRIYAYMRGWGGHYRVELYVEEREQRAQLKTTDVAKHVVYHPFNKTYPENCEDIDKDGKVRLSLLIKWYFVVAGVANDGALKEMNNYAERLRSMLHWVQGRMHSTAHADKHDQDLFGVVAPNEDSENSLSPIEEACKPAWEVGNDTTSRLSEIEELTRSIVQRVTEHVAEERSKDQQDERRLVEIDRQLGQLRTQRGGIEKRRQKRVLQLGNADSVIDTWMSSKSEDVDA